MTSAAHTYTELEKFTTEILFYFQHNYNTI